MRQNKTILIVPDSFKGTMSAIEVADIIGDTLSSFIADTQIIKVPIADGGEGTTDCFIKALDAKKIYVNTVDPFGKPFKTYYGQFKDMAIIELAMAAGIQNVSGKLDPMNASTYGVGLMIKHAIESGCKKIILGIGGSCTTDGGTGIAAALGTKFYDSLGESFIPVGGSLSQISSIDISESNKKIKDIHIEVLCDIDNKLYGKNGAAYIFGPQKGANEEQVTLLDSNLLHYAKIINKSLDIDVDNLKGGGAAGGTGAGMSALLHANLVQGIDTILELINFDELAKNANLVITGEGKLDAQSISGKAVIGIGIKSKEINIPVLAIVGMLSNCSSIFKKWGIDYIIETKPLKRLEEDIKKYSKSDLKNAVVKNIEKIAAIINS